MDTFTNTSQPQACRECGKPAIGIVFTKGNPDDVPLCKRCGQLPQYAIWMSQSFTTAASPAGQFFRAHLKGVASE